MTQKIFSVPLNPKLDFDSFEKKFVPLVSKYKDYIYDIYFTTRLEPFGQDAMGDVFSKGDWRGLLANAMPLQTELGVSLSATFNNINVPPTLKNLNTFVENFSPVYEAGVRIATIPHTIWMLQGIIQKEFPELKVKNTILRNIQRPNEIVKLAEAGFYYVNLDRDLMRDHTRLEEIKKAKEYIHKNIRSDFRISLLANEGCWGNCPVQDEHFEFNFSRESFQDPTYFADAISKPTCPRWDLMDPAGPLKVANFPPWREDWEEFLSLGIDVFKMHGREDINRLWETFDIIEKFADKEEILFSTFDQYINEKDLQQRPIDAWRKKIKTCKFDCWDCHYCENVVSAKAKNRWIEQIDNSLSLSKQERSRCVHGLTVPGLTSNKVKHFLNNLCNAEDVRYLEIGTFQGATFSSAIENNNIQAHALDNWQDPNINPARDVEGWEAQKGNPKEIFQKNVTPVLGENKVTGHDYDIRKFNINTITHKINVVFYDGDHSAEGVDYFLTKFWPLFEETFVLIMDDWNWQGVQEATNAMLKYNTVLYKQEIKTSGEDPNDYWNGLGIFVVRKNREHIT